MYVASLALWILGACTDPAGGGDTRVIGDASVAYEVDEDVATVVRVSVDTLEKASVFVEYGLDTSYGSETPTTREGTRHEITVLGLVENTDYHYRVVATVDGERFEGVDHVFTTGNVPVEVPDFEVLQEASESVWGHYTLVACQAADATSDDKGVVIVNDDGDVVWYRWGYTAEMLVWSAVGTDGRLEYLVSKVPFEGEPNALVRARVDSGDALEIEVPDAHHVVVHMPDGGWAVVTEDKRSYMGEEVIGDSILVYDETGESREAWNAWDTMEVFQHEGWGTGDGERDWTHVNGLYYDEGENAFYVSFYWLSAVSKVDADTGEILWTLGGVDATLAVDGGHEFLRAHSPELLDDGRLAIFDNEREEGSSIVLYDIDEEASTAHVSAMTQLLPDRNAIVLGEIDELDDGTWFTTWGDLRRVAVMEPDGNVLLQLETEDIAIVGQGERIDSLYDLL